MIAGIRRAAGRSGAARGVQLGIGDDCAILRVPKGHEVLVTTDLSLEGRHFRRDWHPARAVGHRTLARGLSDLAAMGAKPLAAFLSIALPGEVAGSDWLSEFMDGFLGLAKVAGVTLAGGDTAEFAGGVVADIVLTGSAPAGTALRRSGARVGDGIYVTGALGGSAAELLRGARMASPGRPDTRIYPDFEQHPHLFPQPRLAVGAALRRRGMATACIDVSDGISTDLAHLCAESRCGALIEAASLPIHPFAASRADAMQLALHGGEDYELLFTASGRVPGSIAGVNIARIGTVAAGRSVNMVRLDGKTRRLQAQGWEHFRK
ncbi:MAG TPA: thiamine-phosphate kinase [Acidobacteriaceae bacterium]